jgi:hypothetical protein
MSFFAKTEDKRTGQVLSEDLVPIGGERCGVKCVGK